MTRYEAEELVESGEMEECEVIDIVFSYLENRTCKNCKHYGAEHEHIAHPNYKTCINVDSFTYMTEPHFTDGCNKWEVKND